ncbi:MAG TPA: hypothetical protein VGN98_03340, partial [Tianweitania sediminis]|nr:hypothetical protein [Tianweitania sediminis]
LLKKLRAWMIREDRDDVPALEALMTLASMEWPMQPLKIEKWGPFALLSTRDFEKVYGKRLRLPRLKPAGTPPFERSIGIVSAGQGIGRDRVATCRT